MIITPLQNATRLRPDHNTAQPYIALYNIGARIYGGEIWTAPETTSYNRQGDQWLKVETIDNIQTTGWVAIVHNGVPICKEIADTPPVEVAPFDPKTLTLIDPKTGETRHYVISNP